jgi:uncharacterized protein YqfB (UPF0267 family)
MNPNAQNEYFAMYTDESMTESHSCIKDQLFVLRKENTALQQTIQVLETKLVNLEELKDDYESLYNNANKETCKLEHKIQEFNGKFISSLIHI